VARKRVAARVIKTFAQGPCRIFSRLFLNNNPAGLHLNGRGCERVQGSQGHQAFSRQISRCTRHGAAGTFKVAAALSSSASSLEATMSSSSSSAAAAHNPSPSASWRQIPPHPMAHAPLERNRAAAAEGKQVKAAAAAAAGLLTQTAQPRKHKTRSVEANATNGFACLNAKIIANKTFYAPFYALAGRNKSRPYPPASSGRCCCR